MRTIRTRSLFNWFILAAAAQPIAAAELPDWMAGHWCGTGQSAAEEHWLPAAGGLMLGMSRTVRDARSAEFEFLRIELIDEVPTYIAMPQGKGGTAFARTAGGPTWIRFENSAHDFPQRIEYRRNGKGLRAEIAGPGEGGKELRIAFEFSRCPD